MTFASIESVLKPSFNGKKVRVRGWVYRKREHKDKIFLIVRDSTDIIQAVVKDDSKAWKDAQKITVESSLKLSGTLIKDDRAPTGYEIKTKSVEIVGLADIFPIARDLSEEFLLDVRHLWLRSRKMQAVLKVRSRVFEAIHNYFKENGFYEFHSPILMKSACEGGSTLFDVKYYTQKAHLSQSWQLHCEAALPALEKIYTITPAFRAEKFRTTRHLTEYWTAEVEQAWVNFEDLQRISEELVSYICEYVAKNCKKELRFLGRDTKYLLNIKPPFPRIDYNEALSILKEDGIRIKWGKDLRTIEERSLMKHYNKPLIITHYPAKVKAFYMAPDPKDSKLVLGFDMLAPETGDEIIGGSQRDENIKRLKQKLKESKASLDDYEFYLDTRRFGSVPHGGFGMGIERVIQWICKLDHIRDAIPFPRTINRVYP